MIRLWNQFLCFSSIVHYYFDLAIIICTYVTASISVINICISVKLMSKPEKTKNKKIVAKVTAVKEIPEEIKLAKIPEYDAVFKQIIESPERMFKMEVEGKTPIIVRPVLIQGKIIQQETRQKIRCSTKSAQ